MRGKPLLQFAVFLAVIVSALFGLAALQNYLSVVDRGGQVFNVKAYGAVCDGTTDDTVAIQAAIDAASVAHGEVLIPPGTSCVVASFITMKNAVTLAGNGKGTIKFTGDGGGACTDAENPVSHGFIRWAVGGNKITGLNLSVTDFDAGTCVLNLQDGTETSGVEIDHNSIGSGNTADTNVGIYSYSNDTISIHDNVFKYVAQPIHGGAHTWAKITIGPNNVFWGQDTTKAMVATPPGSNCFSVSINSNVFEGFYSTNGISSTCSNGLLIASNYFGDSSATGGDWIQTGGLLIGNYIDGSGQMASGGHALNGTFNAIGNWIYGKNFLTGGGVLTSNHFLSGPSGGCFITMNQTAVLDLLGKNDFTNSGGAANSLCHANGLTPHPIVRDFGGTIDSTTSGVQSGITQVLMGRVPSLFSAYPGCSADTEGNSVPVNDSSTNTHGATITGGGSDFVQGFCDGTNWVVAYP